MNCTFAIHCSLNINAAIPFAIHILVTMQWRLFNSHVRAVYCTDRTRKATCVGPFELRPGNLLVCLWKFYPLMSFLGNFLHSGTDSFGNCCLVETHFLRYSCLEAWIRQVTQGCLHFLDRRQRTPARFATIIKEIVCHPFDIAWGKAVEQMVLCITAV